MKLVNRISMILPFVAVVVFLVSVSTSAQECSGEIVRVIGADSMAHNVTIYANEFCANKPGCNLVVSGGVAARGWEKLVAGEAEIAMMSAPPTEDQEEQAAAKGLATLHAVIGWGGIVIVTNPSNPVESLTLDQTGKLLSGQVTNWKDVGGPDKVVSVVSVNEDIREGAALFLKNGVIKSHIAPSARIVSYFRSVPPTVSETEGAIGFIRMRNLERLIEQSQEKKIRVIGVKKDDRSPAISPSRESIDEGSYPITRPFMLFISSKAGKCAMDFFKFCEERNPRPQADVPASSEHK